MDATVLRRYLQPSPTLRWHPWAPLAAGVLLLGFVFYLGALWGWNAYQRQDRANSHGYGYRVFMDYLVESKWPGARLVAEADAVDATVSTMLARIERAPSGMETSRSKLEAAVFHTRHAAYDRRAVVQLAEFRLRELSPANARWAETATWCDRHAMPVQDVDALAPYVNAARDYSKVLGREIRPQDLAPAVPGWKCEATLPRKPS